MEVIKVEGLGKRFFIGGVHTKFRTARDAISDAFIAPFKRAAALLRGHATGAAELNESMWAFRNVSFSVNQGEVVGLVGKNGAGKTTMLKVLSRITEPTEGSIEIRGRVGSLLEVGTGFHPELTGRENVFLNGAILGMRKTEIDKRFDEIIEFAEIGKFIDTPVKHYSSGMYVRLAFAVAAHLEPEILIVDEVLSVGDAAFQRKCLGKMGDVASSGRTVLFVSHNMAAVTQLCSRALLLEDGTVAMDGKPHEVVAAYLSRGVENQAEWLNPSPDSDSEVEVLAIRIRDAQDALQPVVNFKDPFQVELEYEVREPMRGVSMAFQILDSQGVVIWTSEDTDTPHVRDRMIMEPGTYVSTCHVPAGVLRPGRYFVNTGAHIPGVRIITGHQQVLAFDISSVGFDMPGGRQGVLAPKLDWDFRAVRSPEPVPEPQL
ncbi:MAG: ABC transporter ATP-binding protein [Gemmatimonadota bacterium]|nr:ABC transporter ATP-binding protein [Gemmatimonadota bacterium]